MEPLKCTIVTPDKTLYDAEAIRVYAPGIHGPVAILPQHTPLYSQLIAGEIEVIDPQNKSKKFKIEAGILRVRVNRLVIVVGF